MVASRFALYARTLRHIPPHQIASRVRLRLLRSALKSQPERFERRWTLTEPSTEVGWPTGFVPLDRRRFDSHVLAEEITGRHFTLLNRTEEVQDDWNPSDVPQLWRYHLHYWDWSWNLVNAVDEATASKALEGLYSSWQSSTRYGRWDAWSPYVVALRLWTWCGIHGSLPPTSPLKAALVDEVRRHAGYLRANLETDVGGNHLVKDLKALIGAGVFLDDDHLREWASGRLIDQVRVQVLSDGGHYERSPSYHGQVLGDLIDVCELLRSAGFPPAGELLVAVEAMRAWLAALIGPDGDVPVFNDGFALGDELDVLGAGRASGVERLQWLAASGYVVVRPRPDVQVVIDVGLPCPDELPAHAHADCLSFELVVGDSRRIVDAGTSEYGATDRRAYERSTAAHNTVEVDGENQTEVWGAFRAARRARPTVLEVDESGDAVIVDVEHDGYGHLSGAPIHRRRMTVRSESIEIVDTVRGYGAHRVVSRLREAPLGNSTRGEQDSHLVELSAEGPVDHLEESWTRTFGVLAPATVHEQQREGKLPISLEWSIEY